MRKNTLLLLLGICIAGFARSQQLSPSIIASDGGISKAAGISLEWTLGEPTVESLSTSDRLYTQGFHQPILLVKKFHPPVDAKTVPDVKIIPDIKTNGAIKATADVKNDLNAKTVPDVKTVANIKQAEIVSGYKVIVAPNPVQSILIVNITSLKNEKVSLSLLDCIGRQFKVQTVYKNSSTIQVDMSLLLSGVYLLELHNVNGQLIQSFKIIKGK